MSKSTAGGAGGGTGRGVREVVASYTEATTDAEAVAIGERIASKWVDSLTGKEVYGIQGWKDSDYQEISMGLRWLENKKEIDGLPTADGVREKARGIDSALEKASLPENLVVWRGMYSVGNLNLSDPGTAVGRSWKDESFLSTSISPAVAGSFGDAVFRIELKKGEKAQYIDAKKIGAHADWQREVLVQRNKTYTISKHIGFTDVVNRYDPKPKPRRVPVYAVEVSE